VLLGALGCAGRLSDEEAFFIAADAGASGVNCDAPSLVFAPNCTTAHCHTPPTPAVGLDLSSPGVAARLANAASRICVGQILVVPGQPNGSYLYQLIRMTDPICGTPQMPLGATALTSSEVSCVSGWIANLGATGSTSGGTTGG
jgi:hypothetical protein